LKKQEHPSYQYVDTKSGLDSLIARMQGVDRVAVDTEADSLYHYHEKTCLIQLSMEGENTILDPLAGLDLTRFLKVLAGKRIILHASDYDLRMLFQTFGFRPEAEVFDSMLAAQLLGFDKIGLAAQVERYFGVVLVKQSKKSDWSRRPLSLEQLDYACDDTRFLEDLADKMGDDLTSLGRDEWHGEWCRLIMQITGVEKPPPDPERVWRIKGLKGLSRRELAVVRSVWRWREAIADRSDLPPFKIMGAGLMIEIACWSVAKQRDILKGGPKLPRNIRGRRLEALRTALFEGCKIPSPELPDHFRGKRPEPAGAELKALRKECAGVAEELRISQSVLAPRAALESILKTRPESVEEIMECGPLMHWQAELIAPCIRAVLGNGS
jgi:ribonuclease D